MSEFLNVPMPPPLHEPWLSDVIAGLILVVLIILVVMA